MQVGRVDPGRVCRLLAASMLLMGSAIPVIADEPGWFEVKRSAEPNGSTVSAPTHAKTTMARQDWSVSAAPQADRQAVVLLDNGWQAVPSMRQGSHKRGDSIERSIAGEEVSNVTSASVDTLSSPTVQKRLLEPQQNAQATLIQARGEIREMDTIPQAWSDTLRDRGQIDGSEPDRVSPQQRRNRLPDTDVATLNIDMFAGEVRVLGKVDVDRVAIGNGSILRADVLKTGELLVIGEVAGSTSLRLWHKDGTQSDYNIRVSADDPETRVRMERMVRMRVRMIEFRKSALGQLGIDWSDSATGPGFAIAGDAVGNNLFRLPAEGLGADLPNTVQPFTTYFGVASSITSRINFLASTGDAVTLAEPVLSTTNGGTASFLAGGEVPYPVTSSNGQTSVQFKEYGIKLNVSPLIDAAGNVRTQVETEISQIDPAVSVRGAPGLLTRRAQTQVNVRSGETIVISGLLSSENSKDIDKLPGIGNLPIIGSFFRSQSRRKAVSELVIFVTPEIVDPAQAMVSERHQSFLRSAENRVQHAQRQLPQLD